MRISRVRLRNYRAYESLDLDLNPGMNVIVGENNVGKSSLMQAVQLVMSLPTGNQLSRDYWPDGSPKGPLSILVELVLTGGELEKISAGLPNPQRSALRDHLLLSSICQSPFQAMETKVEFIDHTTGMPSARFRPNLGGYTTDPDGATVIGAAIGPTYPQVQKTLIEGALHFPEFRQRPASGEMGDEENPRSPEGTRLAAVLFRLKNGPLIDRTIFERIQHSFHSIFSKLELQVIKRGNQPIIVIKRSETNHELPLAELGGGILEMLLVLTHVVDQQDKIFTIDEPEAHLHPHSQRVLANELQTSSSKNQFLVITHSPQFVDFKNLNSILLVRENSGRSNIVKLPTGYLSKDEEVKASKIVWSEDKEFLFSRRVLLVEGETEYAAMPILAKRLGKSFDENGVSVVTVGGRHFGLFIKILKGFKFPFRVMCDADLLMKIDGSVGSGISETRASSLFETASQLGQLGEKELELLWNCQDHFVTRTNKKGVKIDYYDDELFDELKSVARKMGFDVLSPDFEGYLKMKGFEQILREADALYGNNKILTGRFVATTIQTVPKELASIISEVVSL